MSKSEITSLALQVGIERASLKNKTIGQIYDMIFDFGFTIGVDNKTGDWVAINSDDVVVGRVH